jgi:hypothetical protein
MEAYGVPAFNSPILQDSWGNHSVRNFTIELPIVDLQVLFSVCHTEELVASLFQDSVSTFQWLSKTPTIIILGQNSLRVTASNGNLLWEP